MAIPTKRSVKIGEKATSVSLETPFWEALIEIAEVRRLTVAQLVGEIDGSRSEPNLSSAIRVFVLNTLRSDAANSSAAAPP